MDNAIEQLGHLCFPIKDYFWRQNENSSLTYTVKKRRSLLFEWSRPTSFLLDQNIFLTQFSLQTRESDTNSFSLLFSFNLLAILSSPFLFLSLRYSSMGRQEQKMH